MRVDVSAEDIAKAEVWACAAPLNHLRENVWHNPLAYAIERKMQDSVYAHVSLKTLGLAYRGTNLHYRIDLNGEVEIWMREWRNGLAKPHSFFLNIPDH